LLIEPRGGQMPKAGQVAPTQLNDVVCEITI
jgi:hypothetical protein